MRSMIVGLPWYKAENFVQLRLLFEDSTLIQTTYAEWIKSAEVITGRFHREGRKTVRIDIDPVEFPRWCAEKGIRLDGASRCAYADHMVDEMMRSGTIPRQ